jgi:sterol desaturase/sphingolipid hydroxylase (fatty acid hydroxylase superfamily)
VKLLHQAIFVSASLVWSFLMFSYLHDRMHIDGFWMEENHWLRSWFLSARRAHDIHHWALDHQGFMDKNFGIGFFLFDRCFGTFTAEWPVFNKDGYAAAKHRFVDLLPGAGRHYTGAESMCFDGRSADSNLKTDAEAARATSA